MKRTGTRIEKHTCYVRDADVIGTEIDNELVLLSLQGQQYFGLPETARRIWQLLDVPRSLADICIVLTSEYDVEPATCEHDVAELMIELADEALIHRVDQ